MIHQQQYFQFQTNENASHLYRLENLPGATTHEISFQDNSFTDNDGDLNFEVFQFDRFTVTIEANPTTNAGSDISICEGESISLDGSGTCSTVGLFLSILILMVQVVMVMEELFTNTPSGNFSIMLLMVQMTKIGMENLT